MPAATAIRIRKNTSMTRHSLAIWLAGALVVGATVSAAMQAAENRVLVSVEISGAPARDLKASEIVVQVDGVERRVRNVQPTSEPVSLVIVADAAITDAQYLRAAADAIVNGLRHGSPASQIAVLRLSNPPVSFIAASAPDAEHRKQIAYLSATTTHSYADGILEAARALSKTAGPRRVIFVMTRKTAPLLESAVAELRSSGASILGSADRAGLTTWRAPRVGHRREHQWRHGRLRDRSGSVARSGDAADRSIARAIRGDI